MNNIGPGRWNARRKRKKKRFCLKLASGAVRVGDRTGKKKRRVCHAAGGSDENGSGRLVETSRVDKGTPPRCSHEVQVCKIRVIWIRGRRS